MRSGKRNYLIKYKGKYYPGSSINRYMQEAIPGFVKAKEKEKVKIVRKFNLHGSVWQKWKQDDDRIRK